MYKRSSIVLNVCVLCVVLAGCGYVREGLKSESAPNVIVNMSLMAEDAAKLAKAACRRGDISLDKCNQIGASYDLLVDTIQSVTRLQKQYTENGDITVKEELNTAMNELLRLYPAFMLLVNLE